ncbi:MAG: dihydrofolate reductase family protein [Solirubrobacteraceae bacterium]|nr:dihydrofolate reductase family protein [Solirubrobacteraceae bacterium]
MRTLIVSEFVTLDGVMEAPGGEPSHPHTGWVGDYASEEFAAFKLQEIQDAEALLLGRVTYESFAGAWPDRTGPMAEKTNAMPKLVASTTLTDPGWENARVLQGDVADAVAAEKAQDGGPLLVAGSCTLVHTLLCAGLVDELRLMVFPVAIGSGLKVFPESPDKLTFTLADSVRFTNGVLVHTYRQL